VKRALALGTDPCWQTTSGAHVEPKPRSAGRIDYICSVIQYTKKQRQSKGHQKYGPSFRSQIEAEDALFFYRHSIESKASRKLVDDELKKRLGSTVGTDAPTSARASRAE